MIRFQMKNYNTILTKYQKYHYCNNKYEYPTGKEMLPSD